MVDTAESSAGAARRFRHAPLMHLIAESVVWGAMMAGAAVFSLISEQGRAADLRVLTILTVFFVGGVIGYGFAYPATHLFAKRLPARLVLPFAVVMLAGFTLAATAGILALDYRAYYAEWHEVAFSRDWFSQQFYTALSSTYQYLVIGTRFYWPLGPLFLLLAGWWVSKRVS